MFIKAPPASTGEQNQVWSAICRCTSCYLVAGFCLSINSDHSKADKTLEGLAGLCIGLQGSAFHSNASAFSTEPQFCAAHAPRCIGLTCRNIQSTGGSGRAFVLRAAGRCGIKVHPCGELEGKTVALLHIPSPSLATHSSSHYDCPRRPCTLQRTPLS
jgi:hypothetical protein